MKHSQWLWESELVQNLLCRLEFHQMGVNGQPIYLSLEVSERNAHFKAQIQIHPIRIFGSWECEFFTSLPYSILHATKFENHQGKARRPWKMDPDILNCSQSVQEVKCRTTWNFCKPKNFTTGSILGHWNEFPRSLQQSLKLPLHKMHCAHYLTSLSLSFHILKMGIKNNAINLPWGLTLLIHLLCTQCQAQRKCLMSISYNYLLITSD